MLIMWGNRVGRETGIRSSRQGADFDRINRALMNAASTGLKQV